MGSCCCDCDDIDQYDVDELLDEINLRLKKDGWTIRYRLIAGDDLMAIREALAKNDSVEATWLFDQAIFPKWKAIKACEAALKKARMPAPSPPKIGLWMYAECG